MTPENRRHNVAAEWALSDAAAQEARDLLSLGHHRACIVRAYYSAFHAARAALLSRESEPSSHSGVRSQFHHVFVHTGLVDRSVARALGSLQKDREDADYSRETTFTAMDARDALDACEDLRAAVQAVLRAEGWMA